MSYISPQAMVQDIIEVKSKRSHILRDGRLAQDGAVPT